MDASHDPPLVNPTIRSAGYQDGDFYPIYAYSTRSVGVNSTTQSAWTGGHETNEFQITDDLIPKQTYLFANYRGHAHGDELTVRLWNDTDAEAIPNSVASVTGFQWKNASVGPLPYDPPTTSAPIAIQPEFHNSDGATEVDLSIAQVEVGVRL